jgi:hypothetical protein
MQLGHFCGHVAKSSRDRVHFDLLNRLLEFATTSGVSRAIDGLTFVVRLAIKHIIASSHRQIDALLVAFIVSYVVYLPEFGQELVYFYQPFMNNKKLESN